MPEGSGLWRSLVENIDRHLAIWHLEDRTRSYRNARGKTRNGKSVSHRTSSHSETDKPGQFIVLLVIEVAGFFC